MNSCDPTQNGYVPTNDFVLDQSGSQVSEVAWSGGTATLQHTNVWANGARPWRPALRYRSPTHTTTTELVFLSDFCVFRQSRQCCKSFKSLI